MFGSTTVAHPMDVASILLKNGAPDLPVIAGFLHEVIEDTNTDSSLLRHSFGNRVSDLVKTASEMDDAYLIWSVDGGGFVR